LAETAYVTDILVLGLHEAEDTSDQPFRNLTSGAELEVLERVSDYALVQTTSGEQGWVRAAYLVADKPARLRVSEVEAALEIMRAELTSAQDAQQNAESYTEELGRNIEARETSSEAVLDTLARLRSETESYEARMEAYRGSVPLSWVFAALAVALIAGFFAGVWCLDALIRRRHGGFRVY
jgi:SH3 domain protein